MKLFSKYNRILILISFLGLIVIGTLFFLYRNDGSKRIADNALVALTLLIAESKSEEKDIMDKAIVNLINSRNS